MSKIEYKCCKYVNSSTNSLELTGNNNQIVNEKKKSKTKRLIQEISREFFENNTLHGFRYLISKQLWERIFWLLVIIASIFICSKLIYKTYVKWEETPVIVSFSEKSTPVWHIPFPAITICSETKTQKKIINFTEAYMKLLDNNLDNETIVIKNHSLFSPQEHKYLQTLMQICSTYLVKNINEPVDDEGHRKIIDHCKNLDEIIPDFKETYQFCRWKDNLNNCPSLFKKAYTEQGICYTFNGLSPSELYREESFQYQYYVENTDSNITTRLAEWSLESGYSPFANETAFPERVLGSGIRAGLFMVLQGFEKNLDYICRGPVQGFKVILHSPDDAPQVSKQFTRVPFNKEILVSVSPKMITTTESLRQYSPDRRQCFFSTERYLKYFKVYTQANCEAECLANYTLSHCGCVHFAMLRNPETPVCDVTKLKCCYHAEHELLKYEFTEGLKNSDQKNSEFNKKCNCLPACTSLVYQAEISQADFDMRSLLKAYNDTSYVENHAGFKMSRLLVFFKEKQFITSRRSELYGIIDFLANCGGLFGLFMGFSVLSIVDIFYYLLRFVFKIKYLRKKRNFKINKITKKNSEANNDRNESFINLNL